MRRRPIVLVLSLAVVLATATAGCGSGEDGGTAPPSTASSSTTTTSSTGGSVGGDGAGTTIPSADPATVPDGYRALHAPRIALAVAVPDDWTITDLVGDDLNAEQLVAVDDDPYLRTLLAGAGSVARLAAVGPAAEGTTPLVTLSQLGGALPDDPAEFAAAFERTTGAVAADVTTARIDVPGVPAGQRATAITATREVGGVELRSVLVLVPTSGGTALATVRADGPQAERILATLAAS